MQRFLFGEPREKAKQTPHFLPKTIFFRSIPVERDIHYIWKNEARTLLVDDGRTLTLSGTLQRALVKKTLKTWIAQQARNYFTVELNKISQDTKLHYSNLRFKNTKTRWGSCSDKKNINLNIQLLFLPKHLSHQVLLHELCHLVHLNHSKSFWNLLATFEPNYKKLERELRHEGRKYIPGWMLQ